MIDYLKLQLIMNISENPELLNSAVQDPDSYSVKISPD